MYYHVRISTKSSPDDEVRLDMSAADLDRIIINPYYSGEAITLHGRTIRPDDITRVRISQTPEAAPAIRPTVEKESRDSVIVGIPIDWLIADAGTDVTEQFIIAAPGSKPKKEIMDKYPDIDKRRIFVVHGRDFKSREAMFEFLRSLDLRPIEWSEAIKGTRKPSPYVGEILEYAFSVAGAIVVLFTPDDIGHLKDQFQQKNDPDHEREPTPQARLNVIFEAGMAMGKCEDRTIMVEIGKLRPFSDIGGRHVIKFDGSPEKRKELAERLGTAGCPVNDSSSDWLKAGDFGLDESDGKAVRDGSSASRYRGLSNDEIAVLKVMPHDVQNAISCSEIASQLGIAPKKIQYMLNRLESIYFIVPIEYATGRPNEYYLTSDGLAYLVENNLLQ